MYYVLRTHGEIESHWGFTAVATAKTQHEAEKIAFSMLRKEPTKDKYVIVKSITSYRYIWKSRKIAWEIKEIKL